MKGGCNTHKVAIMPSLLVPNENNSHFVMQVNLVIQLQDLLKRLQGTEEELRLKTKEASEAEVLRKR